jgi:glycerol uptake facilitator protein
VAVLINKGWTPYAGNKFGVGFDLAVWFGIAIAFGIAVIAMIYAFGHISGTHINPAVSVALWATKRMPANDMVAYIIAQLIGATLASASLVIILGSRAAETGLGATGMFDGVTYIQAIFCEAVGTFILVLTIMGSAVDKRAPSGFAGLAIGLVVAAIIVTIGNITGSSLNPARTFGPYLADSLFGGPNMWAQFPIYVIGPIVGGLVAAFLYDYIAEPKKVP